MGKRFRSVPRWVRVTVIVLAVLGAAFAGLWQIDMVRQTLRVTYMSLTGKMWKLRGQTQTVMVRSDALEQMRQVIVYLPPDYDLPASRNRRYPVFYLIHGFPDTGDGWVRWGLAPQLVDQCIVNGNLPPLIVVMPDSHGAIGKFGDGEYLDAPTGNGKPGTQLATYIARDIPRWTDAHYRSVPTPLGRLIGGESTGGYGAVNLGLQHPEVFGTMLSLSGYFEVDRDSFGHDLWPAGPNTARVFTESPLAFVPQGTAEQLAAWRRQFVYLGNGLRDYRAISEENVRMENCLKAAQIPYTHNLLPGHHSWDQWRITLVDGLENVRPRLEAATAETAATGALPRSATPTSPGASP